MKLYGVLGNPIKHSLSPLIHNDAFKALGMNGSYLPFLVEHSQLKEAVYGMKALGAGGFNVTVPFKTAIIPYLDALDPFAEKVGAVNTVVIQNGRLKGYNTDGAGYVEGLTSVVQDGLRGKKILMIGAGGAARGIYFAMGRECPAQMDIANRTVATADRLIQEAALALPSKALSLMDAERALDQYDIIIQTTSVGLQGSIDKPLSLEGAAKGTVMSDIIYNPFKTAFLREAEQKECVIQNGIEMFVNQAALAFELWTGKKPDRQRMKQCVLHELGGK